MFNFLRFFTKTITQNKNNENLLQSTICDSIKTTSEIYNSNMLHFRNDKFIIVCAARSGSTMLVHLLRSHPNVQCHGEVFLPDKKIGAIDNQHRKVVQDHKQLSRLLSIERTQNLPKFVYDFLFHPQPNTQAIGFKFKSDEFIQDDFRDILELIKKDTDIKIIHLIRKSFLDQYISHWVVNNQTHQTLLLKDESISDDISKFRIDISHFEGYINDLLERENITKNTFINHRSLEVYYEDMVNNLENQTQKLIEFLNLEKYSLETSTRKIIRGNNKNLVTNLNDVINTMEKMGLGNRI